MKATKNLKMRYLCWLMFELSWTLISGCNSGGEANASTGIQKTAQTAKVSAATSPQPNGNPNDYTPLPKVELGWGYDPDTDAILPISINQSTLISPLDGTFQVVNEASKYQDYAELAQDTSISANQSQYSFSGGVGVNYGLYSGSIKAAYSKSSQNTNGALTINKAVGLAGSMRSHFQLNPAKMTQNSKNSTGAAIYAAAPITFKDAIDNVRNATNDYDKAQAVLDFYANYGTHFISSVTKGYLGVININLTQIASQSSVAKAGSVSASVTSPYASASANYSQQNASSFSKSAWNYTSSTFTTPDDSGIRDQLAAIQKIMDTDVTTQSQTLSFENLTKAQTALSDQIKLQLPDLEKLTITVDSAAKDAAEKAQADYKALSRDLGTLKQNNDKILQIMATRDGGTPDDKQTYNDQIQKILDESFKPTLDFFNSGGKYDGKVLTSQQNSNLIAYKMTLDKATTETAEVLKRQEAQTNDDQARQKKLEDLKTGFNKYLETVIFPAGKKENQTFDQWFDGQDITKIQEYGTSYQEYLKKQGVVPPSDSVSQIKSLHQQIAQNNVKLLKSNANAARNFADTPAAGATLDFDIIPWANIFPELNSSAEFIDNPTTLIKIKLLKTFNHLNDLRSYLLLCALQSNSTNLQKMYTTDSLSRDWKVITNAISDFSNSSGFQVVFNDTLYDLSDADSVADLNNKVNSTIHNLKMTNSGWNAAAEALMSKGLVAPQGSAVAINKMLSSHLRGSSAMYSSYAYSSIPLGATLGQQFANIINGANHYINLTAEPIVTEGSQLVDGGTKITNVAILLSEPVEINSLTTTNFDPNLLTFHLSPDSGTGWYQTNGSNSITNHISVWVFDAGNPGVGVKLQPLDSFNTESLKTALGGAGPAKALDPRFKLFYSGEGAVTIDKLYYMSGLR